MANKAENVQVTTDGRARKERSYWSKTKEHTMTKDPAKYDQTGALRVTGTRVQFRNNYFETNKKSLQDYIEASDDWMVMVFPTAKEAGLLEPPGERVLTMVGTNAGKPEPSPEGFSRTYKKESVEYEEPPPDAPEDLTE